MCPVVLHKLNALLLLFPELYVAIHTACDEEVAAGHLDITGKCTQQEGL
jgi:hypothetical protein